MNFMTVISQMILEIVRINITVCIGNTTHDRSMTDGRFRKFARITATMVGQKVFAMFQMLLARLGFLAVAHVLQSASFARVAYSFVK